MQNRDDNNKEISIYELIKKNIQPNGRLEENFRLLDEELTVLDDGEKDVQCLEYIDNIIEADIKNLIDIILKISTDNFDEIEKELKIYFKEYKDTILIYRKPLYNYFTLNRDISSLNNIFNFFKKKSKKALFFLKNSAN